MFPSSFSDLSDFSERPPWLLVSGSDIGFLIVYWSVYMVFFVLSYLIFWRWNAKVWIQTLWAWWVSNIWTMKISFWDFLLFPNQSIFARIQSWSYFIRIPNKIHVLKPNSLTSDHKGSTDPKPQTNESYLMTLIHTKMAVDQNCFRWWVFHSSLNAGLYIQSYIF